MPLMRNHPPAVIRFGSEWVFSGAPLAHEVRIGPQRGQSFAGARIRSAVVQRGLKAQLRDSLMAGWSSAAFKPRREVRGIKHAEWWARRDPGAGTCRWFSAYLCCMAAETRVHR